MLVLEQLHADAGRGVRRAPSRCSEAGTRPIGGLPGVRREVASRAGREWVSGCSPDQVETFCAKRKRPAFQFFWNSPMPFCCSMPMKPVPDFVALGGKAGGDDGTQAPRWQAHPCCALPGN